MKILIVCRYKEKLAGNAAPFVIEQGTVIEKVLRDMQNDRMSRDKSLNEPHALNDEPVVDYFLVRGNYITAVKALKKKIRELRPDVIHAHYGLSGLVANLATRRVPVVCTYHGTDINNPKVRLLSKIAMRMSAWNIFVSQRNVDIAKPRRHWSLIPCGIHLPLPWSELQKQKVEQLTLNQWVESVLEKGKKHVLFAGAFDNEVKNAELAFGVIEELRLKNEDLELIELKGYTRNQVNALMYNCDAFLMTSKTEGSPQVIKETMACGCPIVSVDVGDVKERIANLEGCYVVPIGDRSLVIGNLVETLKKALAFEGRTNGRERIIDDGLSNEQVARRIIAIYESVLREE